ncbi:choice-of-anchor L domain-containing protein [Flavobacterium sp.]|uniref:choice-of-anchor L domain-containing protein n=3 Tax=Flavobacterium sp. TaxID=239 RepID=UPI004033D78F
MKKILFFAVLLSSLTGFCQVITVNTNQSSGQLVNNVLVNNSCLVQITNVTTSTGSNFGSSNGIGSYQNTNPAFPAGASGLLLTTGQAVLSPGPNNTILSNGGSSAAWGGNAELETALAAQGVNITSKNATVFQFDFVPNSSNFGLDFLFASEEYGAFQCTSNDAFVVLLDNLDDAAGPYNVAMVPSTTDPVTVSNIRNNLYLSACPSVNANYFGAFNGGSNAAGAAINYNGQTKLMHVGGVLVPNAHYRIKLIIADDGGDDGTDGDYDSAVFIPSGSLNLGHQIFGVNYTGPNALCYGQSHVLDTGLDPAVYDFEWKLGNQVLAETGPALTIDGPGTYSVTLSRADIGCVTTQSVVVQYTSEIPAGQPNNLYRCENQAGTYTYDLSVNTPLLTQGLNPNTVVTYHSSQTIAENDGVALPSNYTSPSGATIWARVENPDNGCYTLRSFQLLTSPPPTATQPGNLVLCEGAQSSNSAIFNLNLQDPIILGAQPISENTISYFTSMAAANLGTPAIDTPASFTGTNQTIYARVQKSFDPQCFSITTFNLVVNPLPVLPASQTINACNSYTLPALATGAYYTGNGGTGTQLAAGTAITTSQIVYVYAQSGGTPNCTNQSTLTINIVSASTAPSNVTACQSYTLPALNPGEEYHSAPNGGGTTYPAGHVITSTQTVYFFIPAAASCTQNNSFTVTITNTPTVTELPDVNQCQPYVLPILPNGQNYYTGTNGSGTQIPAGTPISTSQTIYIYVNNPSNPACTAQSDLVITINGVQVVDSDDIVRCNGYPLPALTVGNYYNGPGGTGGMIAAGTTISASQTVYIFAQVGACTDEDSFVVTINPLPTLPAYPNVTVCGTYSLPNNLPSYAHYYTGTTGTGTMLAPGTIISNSQTIYVYTDPNEFGCRRQRVFTVTIIDAQAITPNNQTVCGSYTLPALSLGQYRTAPGGGGSVLAPGTVINSTQTIYVYIVSNSTPPCTAEDSFTITIKPIPTVTTIPDVVACTSYTLPAITVTNGTAGYYTAPQGGGTMIPAGTALTSSQTVYIYAQSGGTPNCVRQRQFNVTIVENNSIAPPNVISCSPYTLPALPVGNYYPSANGGGTIIPAGTVINISQTIYTYVNTTVGANCTGDDSFTVTINPQVVADDPADVVTCTPYELPALTNGNYFTGPDGGGTQIAAGTIITESQTLYVYNTTPNTVNCAAENSFTITIETIDVQDLPDVLVCGGYVLPELTSGNYYTGTGGSGTQLNEGDLIDADQTIYIYGETNTTPPCSDEESFEVVIKPAPVIDDPGNAGSCGPYVLPALTGGNYFTGPGGSGTQYFEGQVITETTQLYIYADTGGTPNCSSENPFLVVINPAAPEDVSECGSYELPPLEVGNYFTGPAGTGTPKFAGDIITTTQDMYVYVDLGPGVNCTDNNVFTITITPYPVLAPVTDVVVCDNYELPALAVGNYYTGQGGTGNMLPGGSYVTSTQTVYVYAVNGTSPQCVSEDDFLVTINNTPLVDARSDVLACESYTLDHLIVGNYFTGPGGTGTPMFEGNVITDTMTVYIYADSGTTPNCPGENSFLVEVFHVNPDAPADVEVCNSYTLPALTEGGYFANPGGPDPVDPTANPEIPAGTVLTAPYDADLYVYSQTGGTRINCNEENIFHVTVNETPVVATPADVAQCTPYALPALTAGSYYTGPGGTGTVMAEGFEITTPMTVYIYAAVGTDNMCSDEHSYFVDVNIVDVPERPDVTACGQFILPALPATQGNYFTGPNGTGTMLNPGDAITATGPNTIYIFKSAGTTVVCTDQSDFIVTIIQAPVPQPTDPVVVCGIDDLGHGIFNLVPAMQQSLGGQPNAVISIHETLADAQWDNAPIPNDGVSLPNNTSAYHNAFAYTQTLYVRLESTLSDCYTVGTIQLVVNPRPVATTPEPYEMCDNGGNDTDGIANFDLTTLEDEILGTLNPAQFVVTFFEDLNGANNNTGAIQTPASYNSPSDIIFARVTNNVTGCHDVVEVELIVNPLPVANAPTPYTLCDINNTGDEIEVFDLNTKIDEIIAIPGGTQDGIIVTFFKNFNDANAGTGPSQILNPEAYSNTLAVEAIFVRVTIEETGCYRVVLLDVRVEPVPVLTLPTQDELTVCDTNGTGLGIFDLDALVQDMVNNGPNLQVTFHTTWQDAMDGNNPITGDLANYHNVDPFIQFLYVRVENTVTECTRNEPYMITLIVEPAPQAPEDLEDLVQCDDQDNNGQDNKAYFDLTVQDAVITAALAPRVVTIEYYTSLNSANNGMPKITNPVHYLGTHEQFIWVRVEDPDTECYSVESFQLLLDQPLLLTQPTVLALCNESLAPTGTNNDGITEFDLTVKDEEILGPLGIGQGMLVEYFVTDPRLDPAALPIGDPTAYQNIGPPLNNPQTLFVRVTTPKGCFSYTTLTIKVLPLPVPDTTPDPLVKCDDNNSPDGMEIFNLTDAAADIRNGDATMILTYYTTEQDAIDRINQITNITAYNTATRTIWVRAEANTGNASDPVCFQIVSFEVIVNLLPELGNAGVIEPYAICEQNTDGIATFDFNTHMDEILGAGVDPAGFTIRFFRNAGDMAANIAMPYIYTNTSSPNVQNIIVRVENNDTGCINTAPLTLLVEEAAIANPITTTFFECDYDGDNDGEFTFDLTVVEPEVLGGQSPTTYSVTYYTSLADAEDGVNAIPTPTAYLSAPDHQMIWVRVTNESTVSGCNDITTLELFVERIPEPVLDADHTTVCIDFVTGENVRAAIIDTGLDATHTFVWTKDGVVMAGETGPTLTVLEPGSYNVVATSATGCVSDPIAPIVIEKSGPASPIGFGYVVGNPFGENQIITVLAQGFGEYQYSLDNGPWQNSNVFENVSAYRDHVIHVRDIATADPCDDLELILDLEGVRPIDYPNFFTPNGDGYHDYWQPFGLGNQPAVVYIFDRYGKLLKQISTSPESRGWDGTYNGTPMPGDDYWFTIEYTVGDQKREFKGHFALKR